MRILILWRSLPSRSFPSAARPYYFIKKYSSKCEIYYISPEIYTLGSDPRELDGLNVEFESVRISYPKKLYKKGLLSLLYRLSYTNLRYSRDFNIARIYYPQVRKKIDSVMREEDFDLIYCDYLVCNYLKNIKMKCPVVLEFFSPLLYGQRILLKYGSLKDKLFSSLRYLFYRVFEVNRYRGFDAGIYVSSTHLELSKPFVPKKSFVIPPSVEIDYFKSIGVSEENSSILFTGTMNHPPNYLSAIYFAKKIHPLIKKEIPEIKLYIVGRSPEKRLIELGKKDGSIIVTGAVPDVRPYFSKASVFVNPIIVDDGGVKNKVLEAMAMGKAIVSTSIGARDLGFKDGESILIADDEKDFTEKVIMLLKDENERKRIGRNARKFVEENHSWDKRTDELYEAFKKVVEGE